MNLRKHGTFQIVLWRPTFVVIGSDTSAMLNMESVAGHPSKLICHDTLPLAIGIGGMAEFTINDKETIVEQLLRDEFPAWGRLERFGIRTVIDWAKTVLQPRVQEGIDDEPHIPQQVTLLVGTMNRGAAESALIVIDREVRAPTNWINSTGTLPPASLSEWRDGQLRANPASFYGQKLTKPVDVAQHAKRIVEDAIREEAKLATDREPQCGGHAEVVIVDKAGAKLVHKAPRPKS